MEIFGLLVLWLHILAAVIWIGGNLVMAMVVVPYFRRSVSPVERIQILSQIGRRFEPIVWGCVLVLIFSGLLNIFLSYPDLTGLAGAFMRTLLIKLLLVIVLIFLTAIHSFVIGPRLSQAVDALEPGAEELPDQVKKIRSWMSVVSSLIGVFSLLVLLAAVALRMGI
jgi:uncharacterized membrane protein